MPVMLAMDFLCLSVGKGEVGLEEDRGDMGRRDIGLGERGLSLAGDDVRLLERVSWGLGMAEATAEIEAVTAAAGLRGWGFNGAPVSATEEVIGFAATAEGAVIDTEVFAVVVVDAAVFVVVVVEGVSTACAGAVGSAVPEIDALADAVVEVGFLAWATGVSAFES
jgi:hypothetical protein